MRAKNRQKREKPSDKLLASIAPYTRVAIVMHDNPDPDAIAAAWALKFLFESKADKTVRVVAGGDIMRAENRHMMQLLNPPIELADEPRFEPQTAVVLVDCGPKATNHLIAGEDITPVAIIDHHEDASQSATRGPASGTHRRGAAVFGQPQFRPFLDIRPRVAASATIVTTYLREQKLEPSVNLATCLLYAIHSETRGCGTCYANVDRAVLPWLTQRADPSLLASIENAPLRWEYFSDLALALQSTIIYDDAAFCMLPRAEGPEIIGEIADLLIRCEGVHRVLCAAAYSGAILLSVRTDNEGGNATELLHATICGMGRGGGHAHRAGGKLTGTATGSTIPGELRDDLRARWLQACGFEHHDGTRLVTRNEIEDNLRSPL